MSYGDWAQWKRRFLKAHRDGTGLSGVNCPHRTGYFMCPPCAVAYREFLAQHPLQPTETFTVASAGRRVAGL